MTAHGVWLARLSGGEQAAILSGGHRAQVEWVTVERLTATQIVLVGDSRRFRRDDGRQVGDCHVKLLPLDAREVRSTEARAIYESTRSRIYRIEKRVDSTNPRTPEVHVQGLRDLHAATSAALAAVNALLASGAAGEAPGHLDGTKREELSSSD